MTTLKEINISSIAEPASAKIERNSKGYNYEVSLHAETLAEAVQGVLCARQKLEAELYGVNVNTETPKKEETA